MDLKKERSKRESWIIGGFGLEMFLFVMSGALGVMNRTLTSIIFLFFGVIIAYIVGLQVKENAVENFKWGLE